MGLKADSLEWVQEALNERPSETLGYKSHKFALNKLISEEEKKYINRLNPLCICYLLSNENLSTNPAYFP